MLETIIDVSGCLDFYFSVFPLFIDAIFFYLMLKVVFSMCPPRKTKKKTVSIWGRHEGKYFAAGRHLNINSHSFLCSINSKKCSLFASLFVYLDVKHQRKNVRHKFGSSIKAVS